MAVRILLRHDKWVGEVVTWRETTVVVGAGAGATMQTFDTPEQAKAHAEGLVRGWVEQGYKLVRSEKLDEPEAAPPERGEPGGLYELFREKITSEISDAERVEALDALDAVLRKIQQWKDLERAYQLVLKTLTPSFPDALKAPLWRRLGDIYRDQLADPKAAERAYGVVELLVPAAD